MSVFFKDDETYKGAVLSIEEKFWMDGMLSVKAVVWDSEAQKVDRIEVGYYGIDGQNLAGGRAEVDATPDTWRQVLRSFRPAANAAFADSVAQYKRTIRKGSHAVVVRGKKVPKGTAVEVFWVGEKPTFQSRRYDWMRETETIAGCYTAAGDKVWIKAEYLQNTDPIQSPNAKERRKFIKDYMEKRAKELGAPWGC